MLKLMLKDTYSYMMTSLSASEERTSHNLKKLDDMPLFNSVPRLSLFSSMCKGIDSKIPLSILMCLHVTRDPWLHQYPMKIASSRSDACLSSKHSGRYLCRGCHRLGRWRCRRWLDNDSRLYAQSTHLFAAVGQTASQNAQIFIQLRIRETSTSVSVVIHPRVRIQVVRVLVAFPKPCLREMAFCRRCIQHILRD